MLSARSIDAALARDAGASLREGRVHSVFARVVNVVAGERLVTLAHRAADDAPDTVLIDLDAWSALDVAPGMHVELSVQRIRIGRDLAIALAGAPRWQCALPRYAADDSMLRANLPRARAHLERLGCGAGLDGAITEAVTDFERTLARSFRRRVHDLARALEREDEPQAHDCIEQLIGLGPGLTPAGDDFLLGLLAALNVPGAPRAALRGIVVRGVDRSRSRTHLISAAALRHAAAGRVRACVVELCRALMHGRPEPMLAALERVMRIGSSSGTEIALGVLAGLRLQLLHAAPHDGRAVRAAVAMA